MEKNQNTIKIMTFSIHSQIQRWRKNKTIEEEEVIEETISEVEEMANIEVEEVAIEGLVLVVLALVVWFGFDSDDDNGGGGLMQPALIPIRVRQR
jgi:hypothetical protein